LIRKGSLLSNVRVVEVAEGFAGPWAGLLLADLGAEVIKVESITRMDLTRGRGDTVPSKAGAPPFLMVYPDGKPGERLWNRNSVFNACNFSKYGVTLDLTKPKGLQALMRLVKVSDAFVSNLAVGVDEKLGITYEAVSKVNPRVIYLSSAGYGRTGPYAKRVAMGNPIDGAAGLFGLRDYGDGDGTAVTPDTHADNIAALTNAVAIVTALYSRQKTGKGMFIDASMVEPGMLHIGEAIMDYTMNYRVQHSLGNRDRSMSPQGCYRCQGEDEWVTLSISSDEEWHRFTEVMGNPKWVKDERFASVLGRLKNQDELDKLVEAWTIHHSKHEVMSLLHQARIAAGAVLNYAEVYSNAHLKERGFWNTVEDPDAGIHTYAGRLWKLSETEMPERRHSPCLGEHNDYVLREIAGLTSEEVSELEQEGIIGTIPINIG